MKRQIRLTETDLHNVIEGAVKKLVLEYTDKELKRMYGYRPDDYDDEDLNTQPTNNLVGENKGQIRMTESGLYDLIKESVKNILSELDWRTIQMASDKADKQSLDSNKPQGFRQKRAQQGDFFRASIKPQIMKDYNLSDSQVKDAIRGKGDSYNTASRRELKSMDKLYNDNERFYQGNSRYENGKWN